MATPVTFTQALADWYQDGSQGKFMFAGEPLAPLMSESFEDCVYAWLHKHHDPEARARTSTEIAGGLRWWAEGATAEGMKLDSRASFKTLEFMMGVSYRLPCLLDNAGPMLAALKSPYFDRLPDVGGPVPLKPALLALAVSAVGAWCFDGQTNIREAAAEERFAAGDLVEYVTRFPGLSKQDALVCLAVALTAYPDLLRPILDNIAPVLPTIQQLRADSDRYEAVSQVLAEAARNSSWLIRDALTAANLSSYLELVKVPDLFNGRRQQIAVEINHSRRTLVVTKLLARPATAGREIIHMGQ